MSEELPAQSTDRELWRETPGDYYSPSIHVTQDGGIGINVAGTVRVRTLREWHGSEARNSALSAEANDLRTQLDAAKARNDELFRIGVHHQNRADKAEQELAAAKDRDFEWWQALCLVDNVAPEPESVKQWLLIESEYHEKELRDQLDAAKVEGDRLKAVIANDTENEESARAIAAEVFGKAWADGDSLNVPNVVDFVERFRDELAAAKKTIADLQGRKGRLRDVLREAQSVVCESKCPSTWLCIEGKPACSDICRKITATDAATDGGV